MANLTSGAQREAKQLYDLLSDLYCNFTAKSLGDLRREIDKAVNIAQYVMDEIGAVDDTLDEYHFDEQEAEHMKETAAVEMQADAAGY